MMRQRALACRPGRRRLSIPTKFDILPEASLHLLEMLGGWPGAILAQRRFRHKCAKGAYQFTFWVIVLLHQSAAYDSLHDWRFSRLAVDRIMSVDQPKR